MCVCETTEQAINLLVCCWHSSITVTNMIVFKKEKKKEKKKVENIMINCEHAINNRFYSSLISPNIAMASISTLAF